MLEKMAIGTKDITILCLSDLHGHLPQDLPETDLAIIAGDICPPQNQAEWLNQNFLPWLITLSAKETVFIAGNHDIVFEDYLRHPNIEVKNFLASYPNNTYYLLDNGLELLGYKIWGSPWQLRFLNWAFNLSEKQIADKAKLIPGDTDILVLHGPPYGILDTNNKQEHLGSKSYMNRIFEINPKLVVFGHIHESYGVKKVNNTLFVNASYLDIMYNRRGTIMVAKVNGHGAMCHERIA